MARLNVNPTRMELKKLKARLSTAVRGHKLLKDKSDEMIRVFSVRLRENKAMRASLEAEIAEVMRDFRGVTAYTSESELELALSMPTVAFEVEKGDTSVMGVEVPALTVSKRDSGATYPYAYTAVSSVADASVARTCALAEKMIALAALEKSVRMLADEIEKNKRRVNALEYVMIPQLEETIQYIRLKLDENERGNLARLMKVKTMLGEQT